MELWRDSRAGRGRRSPQGREGARRTGLRRPGWCRVAHGRFSKCFARIVLAGGQSREGNLAGIDAFGVALVGRSRLEPGSLIVGPVAALRPEGEFTAVLTQVADLAAHYGARIVTDQYSAEAVTDFLRRRGLRVDKRPMSASSKTDVFNELRAGKLAVAPGAGPVGQRRSRGRPRQCEECEPRWSSGLGVDRSSSSRNNGGAIRTRAGAGPRRFADELPRVPASARSAAASPGSLGSRSKAPEPTGPSATLAADSAVDGGEWMELERRVIERTDFPAARRGDERGEGDHHPRHG